MKRFVGVLCAAFIAIILGSSAHAAGVNDFSITSFDIDYELSRDASGRSTLLTTETITAKFPDFDQNHGIERALPKSYDGHPTSLSIRSVTKPDGSEWNYSTESRNDNEVLRIGDADTYVRGVQTYVITYAQRDVTRFFNDTAVDEFYWDTNGTEWRVPIEKLDVQLKIDDSLSGAVTGSSACYRGASGATDTCELTTEGTTFRTTALGLSSGENVTFAVAFDKGTFAKYEQSLLEKIVEVWFVAAIIIGFIGFIVIALLTQRWYAWSSRKAERGTIIPEYLPPKDASIATAATIFTPSGPIFSAQLLDFAVRGYVQIIQTRQKSTWKQAEYDVTILKDITTLRAEEQELLTDIFNGTTTVGSTLKLKDLQNNTGLYKRISDNDSKLKKLVREDYGLRARDVAKSAWFKRTGFVLLGLAVLTFNPVLLVTAIVAFGYGATLWPLTDKGLELNRYLEGFKMYIKVAEAQRLAMLQSPEGALKLDGQDPNDPAKLVKLYEKALPYAVLFGQEKEWSKRIGELYESTNTSPSWYAGNNAMFNAAVFSSAMNGLSTAASYSSASSSSSGGSGGGGSSGGGGGGGGGGGW
jgi:uncharacterized membrane protein YgcG